MTVNVSCRLAVSVVIITAGFAGCFGAGENEPPKSWPDPPAGAGWGAPGLGPSNVTLPPVGNLSLSPGPFAGNTTEMAAFEEFLLNGTAEILAECGAPAQRDEVAYQLGEEVHFRAIDAVLVGCGDARARRDEETRVADAMRMGNEFEVKESLKGEAREALNASSAALSAVGGPGSVVEAEPMMM